MQRVTEEKIGRRCSGTDYGGEVGEKYTGNTAKTHLIQRNIITM